MTTIPTSRLELVREASMDRYDGVPRPRLERPAAAARWLWLHLGRSPQEVLGALYLDQRQRLIDHVPHFRGTADRAAVDPKPILVAGLLSGAQGVLLYHNHPSGDPTPSAEDLSFTRRMDEALTICGLQLVDHIILGSRGRHTSLRERGGW